MDEFSFLLDSETVIDRIKDDLIAERTFSDDEVETLEKWLESGDTQTRQYAANALVLKTRGCHSPVGSNPTDSAIRIIPWFL